MCGRQFNWLILQNKWFVFNLIFSFFSLHYLLLYFQHVIYVPNRIHHVIHHNIHHQTMNNHAIYVYLLQLRAFENYHLAKPVSALKKQNRNFNNIWWTWWIWCQLKLKIKLEMQTRFTYKWIILPNSSHSFNKMKIDCSKCE